MGRVDEKVFALSTTAILAVIRFRGNKDKKLAVKNEL